MEIYKSKEPQALAIRDLIHDTNSGIGIVYNNALYLQRFFEQNKEALESSDLDIDVTKIRALLAGIILGKDRIKSSIDSYYLHVKNDFKPPKID